MLGTPGNEDLLSASPLCSRSKIGIDLHVDAFYPVPKREQPLVSILGRSVVIVGEAIVCTGNQPLKFGAVSIQPQ